MADAVFRTYSGAGYTHIHGGGFLVPADYCGLASLMIEGDAHSSNLPAGADARGECVRARRSLVLLRTTNPIVARTLTHVL